MKKKRVIGLNLLYNERLNGNLENWFQCLEPCDHIYVLDMGSTDNSKEIYEKYGHKTTVFYETENRYDEYCTIKHNLFKKVLEREPDVDWLLWLDGDCLVDGRLLENDYMQKLCNLLDDKGIDMPLLGHYNLWRSDTHYRVDNEFHGLHGKWFPMWGRPHQKRMIDGGLHPDNNGLVVTPDIRFARVDVNIIHKGFSTSEQILKKYLNYKSKGQTGWELDRLIDEANLETEKIPDNYLPKFLKVNNVDPKTLPKLIDAYKDKINA